MKYISYSMFFIFHFNERCVMSSLAVVRPVSAPLHPWQAITRESGLVLHGPADVFCDAAALGAQFKHLDATAGDGDRTCFGSVDGGWTAMALVLPNGVGQGRPTPLLAALPAVSELMARLPAPIRSVHLLRQGPRGLLDWHFEPLGIHQEECRLLVAVQAPADAVTLLGHQAVAYPEGQVWAGDFSFPHRVENPGDRQRIVLALDMQSTPELARLLPPGLGAEGPRRAALAGEACALLASRGGRAEVLTPGAL